MTGHPTSNRVRGWWERIQIAKEAREQGRLMREQRYREALRQNAARDRWIEAGRRRD